MSEPLDKSDLLSTQMKCQGPTLDRKMRNSVCKPGSCIIMKFQAFLPVKKSFGISIQWCKLGVGDDAANLRKSAMKGSISLGVLQTATGGDQQA
ncbi:hypothetical protein WN944_004270 [Citrus x changshan-huyou]|uniref:Uncharacterized protein n=1 Tax=Citrus x changshan-huyou TaxID=2935761 RepID=A0AAP0QIG2_9ROSI